MSNNVRLASAFLVGGVFALAASRLMAKRDPVESLADQPARFAYQKKINDTRALRIQDHFEGKLLADKRVVITGGNRGLGLALVKEAVACGAKVVLVCRTATAALEELGVEQIIGGIDVTKTANMAKLVTALGDKQVDILVNNAGYFMTERESILNNTMDYDEELTQIDICAVGILRVTDALFRAGRLKQGSKVAMITSQGGSIAWRDTQCPEGGDYGHHMSKAAANMAGKLCANELRGSGVSVSILHPGFNKTSMTAKYSHIWEVEGAVDASVGAKRVFHEINQMSLATTGAFINCEDGLTIPW